MYGMIFLFARSVGGIVLESGGITTIGELIRACGPALLYLALFTLVVTSDHWAIRIGGPVWSSFPSRGWVCAAVAIAIGISPLVTVMGNTLGMTYNLVILAIIVSLVLTVLLGINHDPVYAIMAFLFTWPLLRFYEFEFDQRGLTSITWGPVVLTPTFVFVLILFGVSLLTRPAARGSKPVAPMTRAVLLFVGLLSLSILVSPKPAESLRAILQEVAIPVLLYFVVVWHVSTKRDLMLVTVSATASVAIQIFLAYYFYYKAVGLGIFEPEIAYGQMWEHPVLLMGSGRGIASILIFPLALALFLSGKKGWEKVLWGAISLCLILGAVMLQSRTIMLAVALMSVPFLLSGKITGRLLVLMTVSILLVLALMKDPFERFRELETLWKGGLQEFSETRYAAGVAAFRMAKAHPILGVGYGMFGELFLRYTTWIPRAYGEAWRGRFTGATVVPMQDAHNQYLNYAAEAGLLGVAGWIWLLLVALRICWRASKTFPDPDIRILGRGYLAALSGIALTATTPFMSLQGLTFWLVVGLVAALERPGT